MTKFILSIDVEPLLSAHQSFVDAMSEVNHPRDVFREAAADHLISDPSTWFVFLEKRNKSTLIYKREIAEEVFAEVPNFVIAMKDFITKLNTLDAAKIFGSRARNTHKPFSDISLCIVHEKAIPDIILAGIKEQFQDSDIPFLE